jgi:hypothetical protein
MWRRHLIILAVLAAAMVPIALLDREIMGPGQGDWISLDFRGLLIGAYAIGLGIHSAVTSAAIAFWKPRRIIGLHLGGAVVSAALFAAGLTVYFSLSERADAAASRKEYDARLAFSKSVTLEQWSIVGSPEPREVLLRVFATSDGDFAMRVSAETSAGVTVVSGDLERRPVTAGERLDPRVSLTRSGEGEVHSWELHLMFFRPPKDAPRALPSAWDAVSILYEPEPLKTDYDGQFFYRPLPPPSPIDGKTE